MKGNVIGRILKYSFSLALAIGVMWYVLRDVALDDLLDKLDQLDYFWIGLSVFFGLISYVLRAYRWELLLAPLGYRPGFTNTFLAVMVAYLANMALPRLGEVARCGLLKKSSNVPVSASLGTVVAERIFDLLLLLLLMAVTFFLEFDKLKDFLAGVISAGPDSAQKSALWYIAGGFLLVVLLAIWYFRQNRHHIRKHSLYIKASSFLRELMEGMLSVRKLEKPWAFWASTLLIWVMYYLMSYVVVFSMPQTAGISLVAGLSILAMGGIGMAAPVQGGLGTYHLLVSGVLMVYGAPKSDAVLLALILHTSQTLLVVAGGGISLLISFFRNRKKAVVPLNYG